MWLWTSSGKEFDSEILFEKKNHPAGESTIPTGKNEGSEKRKRRGKVKKRGREGKKGEEGTNKERGRKEWFLGWLPKSSK